MQFSEGKTPHTLSGRLTNHCRDVILTFPLEKKKMSYWRAMWFGAIAVTNVFDFLSLYDKYWCFIYSRTRYTS